MAQCTTNTVIEEIIDPPPCYTYHENSSRPGIYCHKQPPPVYTRRQFPKDRNILLAYQRKIQRALRICANQKQQDSFRWQCYWKNLGLMKIDLCMSHETWRHYDLWLYKWDKALTCGYWDEVKSLLLEIGKALENYMKEHLLPSPKRKRSTLNFSTKCDGKSICQHGKIKYLCKDCYGLELC